MVGWRSPARTPPSPMTPYTVTATRGTLRRAVPIEIPERLAPAQRAQLDRIAVALDPVRIDLRVLAQRPPDPLADEELAVRAVRLDAVEQQPGVRLVLPHDLVNDRGAPLPHVRVRRP